MTPSLFFVEGRPLEAGEAAVAALQRALTGGEVARDRVAGPPFAEALGERADYRQLLER